MGRADDEGVAPTLLDTPGDAAASSFADLAPGTTISRYRLIERLGAGAMGVVWSAFDPQLDRKIAIKLVHPRLARTPEAHGRLLREARAMAKLSNRAVVTVHDAGDDNGLLFIAMELVKGTNLGTMLRERDAAAKADWQHWLAIIIEAGRGLAAAHSADVLHRDFKPDNVLVATSGRVCVGDFGLATLGEETRTQRIYRKDAPQSVELTTTGALLGTPAYMSPQGLRGEALDQRSDQFSFCVTAWEALYGERPFAVSGTGLDAIPELASLIARGEITPAADPRIPTTIREALVRGLSEDPTKRWPSMDALLAVLARAQRRTTTTTFGVPRRLRGWHIALGAALLAGGALAAWLATRGSEPAPVTATVATSIPPFKPVMPVPLRTEIAISPDGKRIALGSDRLEVRGLEDSSTWQTSVTRDEDIAHVEFDGDTLLFGVSPTGELRRWHYATDGRVEVVDKVPGRWFGTSAFGEIVAIPDALAIVDKGRVVSSWPARRYIEVVTPSPDGKLVAYFEDARFTSKLFVRDLVRNVTFRSEAITNATALAWLDNTTLLVVTGTLSPVLSKVTVGADGFGTATELLRIDHGWLGQLHVSGKQVFATALNPSPRARIVSSDGGVYDADTANVGAALGWAGPTEYLSWNRGSKRVDRQGARIMSTTIELPTEPANATFAGDVLITALRGEEGRTVVAHALTDGRLLWSHTQRQTLAVRCAMDRAAPCFAVVLDDNDERIVSIDPLTGELGTKALFTGRAEDIAVNADGSRILVAGQNVIVELDGAGAQVATYPTMLRTTRAVAYDPRGGFLVAGSVRRNRYEVGRVHDGRYTPITGAENDILSLVRPSATGDQVLVHVRSYEPRVLTTTLP